MVSFFNPGEKQRRLEKEQANENTGEFMNKRIKEKTHKNLNTC